eukprot:GAHX01004313.1.p1 GENE.GAHX01004313.1~~GAHX01004313.1.p1  ORF type:complete len:53 (+),score=3.83 GAHX01004313.1:298-456(+)
MYTGCIIKEQSQREKVLKCLELKFQIYSLHFLQVEKCVNFLLVNVCMHTSLI